MELTPMGRAAVGCLVLISILVPFDASGEATARGSITVDGETTALQHVLVQPFGSDMVNVLVSDAPFPPACTPLDAMAVAGARPFSGVVISVMDDLTLFPSGNALYHPSLAPMDGYGKIREGLALEVSGAVATGTLRTTVEAGGRAFTIDLELTIPTDPETPPIAPRNVDGDDSEPVRAFVELVDAVIGRDVDGVMGRMTADIHAQMESVGPDPELLADFADMMLPGKMTVVDAKVEGDRAVLTMRGETAACMTTATADGRVELLRENGSWKVAKVVWGN
ncbi:MAG: hypothetical protein ACRD2J_09465 [Thermoanaerobaculia bacterium]